MKEDPNHNKLKSFLKKHWSNILFFAVLILFILPNTRTIIQSWVIIPIIGAPEIIDSKERISTAEYNLIFKDLNGKSINFTQSKGKPVLINFWATWCSPCIAEMPGLVELHNEFGSEVDFYFVSNESVEKLNSFLAKKAYNIPVYKTASKIPEVFDTSSIPTTYLIDKEGNIIARAKGMANWDSKKVKEIIKRLSQ
jgi:thiol-disulfide isomerase/thioredoxin